MFLRFWLFSLLSFGFLFGQSNRDCPDNFSLTPQTQACVPEQFVFSITPLQGSYLFNNVSIEDIGLETSNCENPNDCDWIGAFKGDVCVGAQMWDLETCLNGACSIVLFGNDGTNETYMNADDIPTFKIYDSSADHYYSATPSEVYPWNNLSYNVVDSLSWTRNTPELFDYNVTTKLAYYFIGSISLDGNQLSNEDWVGAFNGDVCVGARSWDTDFCLNGV